MGLVVFLALWTVLGLVAFLQRGFSTRRRRAMAAEAARLGLEFSPIDTFGLMDRTLDVFEREAAPRVENVMWGTWNGVDVRAADLWFAGAPRGSSNVAAVAWMGSSAVRSQDRLVFAEAEVPAWLPHVTIARRDAADFLDANPLPFESREFNRRFRVHADDERVAFAFVDARMMEWLLATAGSAPIDFEANGRRVVAYARRDRVAGMTPLLAAASGFARHVPELVLRENSVPGSSPSSL